MPAGQEHVLPTGVYSATGVNICQAENAKVQGGTGMEKQQTDDQKKEELQMDIAQNIGHIVQKVFGEQKEAALKCLTQIRQEAYNEADLIRRIDQHMDKLYCASGQVYRILKELDYRKLPDAETYLLFYRQVLFFNRNSYNAFLLEITQYYESQFYDEMPQEIKQDLDLLKANCHASLHENAVAGLYYHKALKSLPHNSVSAAWANLGFSHLYPFHEPKRLELLQSASEAFLLNGETTDYLKTELKIIHYEKQLRHRGPELLNRVDEQLALIQEKTKYQDIYDCLLKMKIEILSAEGRIQEAMDCVRVRLEDSMRRFGTETEELSFIHHGLILADRLKDEEAKDEFTKLLHLKEKRLSLNMEKKRQYEARQELLEHLKACEYDRMDEVAMTGENEELRWVIFLVQSLSEELSDIQKMEKMQEALHFVRENYSFRVDYLEAVYARMAQFYQAVDQEECLKYCEKVLNVNRFNHFIIELYLEGLREMKDWKRLLAFCEQQLMLLGEQKDYLILAGEASFQLKDYDAAVSYLNGPSQSSEYADQLLHEALDSGGRPKARQNPDMHHYTVQDVRDALTAFKESVQNETRMSFWRADPKDPKKHKWVEKPESLGKVLLQTSLKGCFRDDILTIEECAAGAGRIDLYLNLNSELSVLAELKMCGERYSAGYAKNGLDQLRHYMKARKTGVGYLIIFDARRRDFGKGFPGQCIVEEGIIYTLVVDVRNTVE